MTFTVEMALVTLGAVGTFLAGVGAAWAWVRSVRKPEKALRAIASFLRGFASTSGVAGIVIGEGLDRRVVTLAEIVGALETGRIVSSNEPLPTKETLQ